MRTWTSLVPPFGRCADTTNGSALDRQPSEEEGANRSSRMTTGDGCMSEAKYRLAMPPAGPVLTARQMSWRPASGRYRDTAFQLQQVPLRLETPGVAAERPVAGDDAV